MLDPHPQSSPGLAVEDLTGSTIGRFAIRARIGGGGMGEVYRAEDLKLKRPVALKRIAPHLRKDETYRRRFLKEAERASSLNVQHVAGIYDVVEENGEVFLVMEYVEGTTLRQKMDGPMGLGDFFDIAAQCGEALAAAHAKGLVHSDIKPENIMISSTGTVKILDFGVAKRIPRAESAGESTATSDTRGTGFSGTPAYMAPEVLLEKNADGRADLFSLGVVLYEALAGKHPFRADSFMGTCDRILREDPPPIRQFNPHVTVDVEQILSRLLAKDPEERYPSAQALLADLRRVQRGSGVAMPVHITPVLPRARKGAVITLVALAVIAGIVAAVPAARHQVGRWLGFAAIARTQHVAVLPFTAVGGDANAQAMCDGLVETLTAKLTRLTGRSSLQVIPAREAKSRGVTTAQMARAEFGVNEVVTGSYHVAGDQVRVSFSLVDAASGRMLDADSITVAAANPFELEDRVVQGVLAMLEVEPRPEEQKGLAAHGTQVAGAYDYYTQGRGYLQNADRPENIDNAIAVLQKALTLDSKYALAHAGLGDAYWRKYEATNEGRWVDSARASCELALKLDADLPAGHMCLGRLLSGTGAYEKAAAEWERSVELEPTSDDAFRGLAQAYQKLGKPEEAEKTFQRAIALRPHYWNGYNVLGIFYFGQARYADAAKQFEQVVALAPDSFQGYSNLGGAYFSLGRYAEAMKQFERSIAIRPTDYGYSNLATTYFQLRRFEQAGSTYEKALSIDDTDYQVWGNLGDAYYFTPAKRSEAPQAYRRAISGAESRLKVNPRDVSLLADLAAYHAMLGEQKAAQESLWKALQLAADNADVRYKAALVYNQFGETQSALTWLEKALQAGYPLSVIQETPFFDNLHSDPRFQSLVKAQPKS